MMVSLVLLRRFLPRSKYFRPMLLESPTPEQIQERERREAIVDRSALIGTVGMTTTKLMPAGKARFADELIDVITSGEMIDVHCRVIVRSCIGNRVIVTLAQAQPAS